ncbi:mitotic checkpoint regulator, MAD2B-interacting-domain-containing protein [Phyllosticta citribraziliensis]|uniref:Mitotic checkpoint regulator, MAD2B-interacting-domain-containing protein n=1 Tax=Phyllosticta citribraziliensis TaxID=989973 RepID=A0ABR1M9V6_9PEZI
MNLVQYSDSEGSDTEAPSTAHPAPKPAVNSKPAFQKVVDRSKPNKIRVNLPSTAGTEQKNGDEPPAKKARTGGGTFSGFNSFLPAPKRAGEAAAKKAAGSGLGKGVSLKTSGAAAFSRQVQEEEGPADDHGTNGANEGHPSKTATEPAEAEKTEEEVKLVGKPMMFKPLSVANNQKKKKKATSTTTNPKPASPAVGASQPAARETNATPAPPKPKPKVSLFSISQEETVSAPSVSSGDYQPILHSSNQTSTTVEGGNGEDETTDDYQQYQSYSTPQPTSSQAAPSANSLTSIAADLNLTAAERRQLFGRQGGKNRDDVPAVNVVNFNTDAEYKANEELRAAGETVQHNPVRAIAPGKHSLKQLVSAASTQKDALEEHFAAGRRNKKEAGSKYGW